ncbi:uncharacterized protein LOC131221504 isoform X2 [Magnolia sinica]|uniref:uncharacterized protein LOC131221504 isoform X2 n=1 Tax=Magnolia sinica TaxID=86752 RepID=UPI00265998C6|nr:uncharacterized protein LOC131221504 isoform X2 [Magnolia sinica]
MTSWFFRSWQTHKNTQIINTQSEVIWQGEIGGVDAALDTFKAEKAFPMCKLTRLLRDSLGGRTKTCTIGGPVKIGLGLSCSFGGLKNRPVFDLQA